MKVDAEIARPRTRWNAPCGRSSVPGFFLSGVKLSSASTIPTAPAVAGFFATVQSNPNAGAAISRPSDITHSSANAFSRMCPLSLGFRAARESHAAPVGNRNGSASSIRNRQSGPSPRLVKEISPSYAPLEPSERRLKAEKIRRLVETVTLGRAPRSSTSGRAGVIAATFADLVGLRARCLGRHRGRPPGDGRIEFHLVEGPALPFPQDSFGIVVSNHVIEHVGDYPAQREHLGEIRRILRGDGVLYLATATRWLVTEPHYRLPFLSWLPRRGADSICARPAAATTTTATSPRIGGCATPSPTSASSGRSLTWTRCG